METQFDRFRDTMKRMLMLDQAELDFGIYRIMNQKRDDIERYLDHDLRRQVAEVIRLNSATDAKDTEEELRKAEQQARGLGIDPDTSPRVQELKAKLAEQGSGEDLENEVYSHLATFFSRYYDGGDFISQRRYKRDVYAIPYEGEEVKLHWANADQYYIKTGEYFKGYRFALGDGRYCEFTLREASTEQNNNKNQNNMERRFALYEELPIEVDGDTLHINFTYELYPKATKQKNLMDEAFQKVKDAIPAGFAALLALCPTSADKGRTLLQKHLTDYAARNQFDYFIHKDLAGFLSRELDFYIKNEVLFIDDIDARSPESFLRHLTVIKAIKAVGRKLIQFLASLEDYQKRLWLKKKFVVQADYCITLDRVPRELYPDICANDRQRQEWVRLFAIDEIRGDGLFAAAYSEPLTEKFLEENPHLVLDTQFFPASFKHRLLSSIDNIDDQCDGLLINSENFQALQLLQEKYREQVKCIYIDPPYNIDGDGFVYKDSYRDSSWLSLMQNSLPKGRSLMRKDAAISISIDDTEQSNLRILCDSIFGKGNFYAQIVWQKRTSPDARYNLGAAHDFITMYGTDKETLKDSLNKVALSESRSSQYKNPDNDPRGVWASVDITGQTGHATAGQYYKITTKGGKEMFPPKGRCWALSEDTFNKLVEDNRIWFGDDGNARPRQKKFLSEVEGTNLWTWWTNTEVGHNQEATKELSDLFGTSDVFTNPKPTRLLKRIFEVSSNKKSTILDFFAGSGTTAHAVINLNRADGEEGKRKYILCEMGDYFDTVTKPRVEKVVYSKDWKDGKPVSRHGSSHCFKYMRLEQYEDTLNNLTLQPAAIDRGNAEFYGGYMMGYLLDTETRESLFSLRWFRNPWAVKLRITRQNETREEAVDLVETFNYLIGLRVGSQRYPADGLCTVEGTTRRGERTLVIWRDCDKISNAALNDFFARQGYQARGAELDRVYANGDNNLEALRRDTDTWKASLTEEEFQKRMFEEE